MFGQRLKSRAWVNSTVHLSRAYDAACLVSTSHSGLLALELHRLHLDLCNQTRLHILFDPFGRSARCGHRFQMLLALMPLACAPQDFVTPRSINVCAPRRGCITGITLHKC